MDISSIILLALVAFIVYFLPTIIATHCDRKHKFAIFLLNLFLGWTFLGWVSALIWSAMNIPNDDEDDAKKSSENFYRY